MSQIEIFPWDDNLNTGLSEIDAQHRQLAGLLNRLAVYLIEGQGLSVIEALVHNLMDCLEDHFKQEEVLWHTHLAGDDGLELEPADAQEAFRTALGKLKGHAGRGSLNQESFHDSMALLLFLSDWLAAHLLETDRYRALMVLAVQSGMTREAAREQVTQQMNGTVSALTHLLRANLKRHGTNILQSAWTNAEKLRKEAARSQREALYPIIVNQAGKAIDVVDAGTLRFIEVNDSACAMLGYTREELIGQPLALIQADLDEAGLRAAVDRFDAAGSLCNVENRYRCKDGRVIDVHLSAKRMLIASQSYLVGVWWDITEHKRQEVAVKQVYATLKAVVEGSDDAIFVKDWEGRYSVANQASAELLGLPLDRLIGRNDQSLFPRKLAGQFRADDRRIMSAGQTQTTEKTIETATGARDFLMTKGPLMIDGKVCGVFLIARDISARKRAELALQDSENRLRLFIQHAPAALAMFDTEMRYLAVSNRWLSDYDLDGRNIIGLSHYQVFPEIPDYWKEVHRRGLNGHVIKAGENRFERQDGSVQWLRWEVRPWYASGNSVGGIVIFSEDISERKQVEAELRSQKDLLDLTGHLAHVGGWQIDVVSGKWSVTGEMLSIYALEPGTEFSDISFMNSLGDADRLLMTQAFNAAKDQYRSFEMELEMTAEPGVNRWIHIIGLPVLENGKVARLEGAVQDVTLRKQAEIALRESENRFRSLTTVAPVGIFRTDTRGNCVYVNPRWCEIAGMRQEDALGNGWIRAIHPDDRRRVERLWMSVTANRQMFLDEYRFLTADGQMTWVMGGSLAEYDGNGQFSGYVGTLSDITRLKKAEAALRSSESRYRSLLEMAPFPAVLWRLSDGTLLYGNQRAQMQYGMRREEGAHEKADRFYQHAEDRARFLVRLGEDRRVDDLEMRMRGSDGRPFWALVSASIVEYEQEPAIFASINDITERKEMEMAIRQVNTELEQRVAKRTAELAEANRELETFTYSVSHDLKAPLRGIDGYSQLLLEDYQAQLDEQGRQFLANVRQGVMQMNRLIDDLLAYSRIEKRDMKGQNVDVSRLIRDLLAERATDLEERGMVVDVRLSGMVLKVDPEGMAMVIRNLVDNAIKFSRDIAEPRLSISASVGEKSVIMQFEDNGIGFDMQFKDSIFEIFQRLQRAEEYPGTGVGLAIVNKAMQRMGGRVWTESIPRSRTIFFLELPR